LELSLAGDTVVRGWSFFISLAAVGVFSLHETWEMSTKMLSALMLVLPAFSLMSPFLNRTKQDNKKIYSNFGLDKIY
jgi:hypothetical protein